MTLPAIPLPLPVPEVIPVLLHPAVVHFAVVLPLVILILELINFITKRKSLTITVYILFILLAVVYLGAYGTGVIDGKNGGLLLSDEGLEHLKAHKQIGIYLLYLSGVPILLKLFTLAVKKPWAKIIYMLSFVGIIALTLFQAKEGGELVYKYGLNVEAKIAFEDQLEELTDEMDEVKEGYEEQIEALKTELSAAKAGQHEAPAVVEEAAEKVEAAPAPVETPAVEETPVTHETPVAHEAPVVEESSLTTHHAEAVEAVNEAHHAVDSNVTTIEEHTTTAH